MEKPGRKKGRDPRAKKAKDNARRTTRRHKIAESAARKIKAHSNQTVRRASKVAVRDIDRVEESAAVTPRLVKRARLQVWDAENAHERRVRRARERAFLDETAEQGPKGRRRAMLRWREWKYPYE